MYNYVIIDTGYTSRLVSNMSHEEIMNWYINNDIVLIKDTLWSKNKSDWIFYENMSNEEIHEIETFIFENKLDGIIVFRYPSYEKFNKEYVKLYGNKLVEFLSREDYCGFCNIKSIYERRIISNFAIIKVDCESG